MRTRLSKYDVPRFVNILSAQSINETTPLELNGELSNLTNTEINIIKEGYSRNIQLKRVGGVGNVDFVIIGLQNGKEVVETLVVGSDAEESSAKIYDKIYSITPQTTDIGTISGSLDKIGYFAPLYIDSTMFNITIVSNHNQDDVIDKKYKVYSALEEVPSSFQEAITAINDKTRNSDLQEVLELERDYGTLSNKDINLAHYIIISFELKDNPPIDSILTLRFLRQIQ
jgi:hypothetical protein